MQIASPDYTDILFDLMIYEVRLSYLKSLLKIHHLFEMEIISLSQQ